MVSAARRVTRSRAESATSRPTSDLHKGVGQRAGLDGRVADKRVNSMIWYKVEINGWHDDRPMTIQATVQASSGKEAVIQAVADEFGVVGEAVEVGFETRHGQRGVRFGIHSRGGEIEWMLEAGREKTFEEMACEVPDAAAVARLNGDPMLPLEM